MSKQQLRARKLTSFWPSLVLLGCNTILGNEPGHLVAARGGGTNAAVPTESGASSSAGRDAAVAGGATGGAGELTTTTAAGFAGVAGRLGKSDISIGEGGLAGSGGQTSGAVGTNAGATGVVIVVSTTGGVASGGATHGTGGAACSCTTANSICHRGKCVTPLEVTAGGFHSCVRLVGGTVECWGSNAWGELGIGATSSSSIVAMPTPVAGLSGALEVAAGARFTCALISGGTVQCWGDNSSGQHGNGTTASSNVPVPVSGLLDVKHIAAGFDFACAVVSDGTARCWGNNGAGQLGDGTKTLSLEPVMVKGLLRVSRITAGFDYACAIVDGAVKCWGDNYYGQLGDGTGMSSSSPVDVVNLTSVTAVAALCDEAPIQLAPLAHPYGSVCARVSDGTARCWGSNGLGELGNGRASVDSFIPVVVTNLEHVESLTAGRLFACASTADGNVKCWGDNVAGQLGSSSTASNSSSTPMTVSQLAKVTNIAAGTWHVCAQLSNGSIVCWGSNDQGQLGDGTRTGSSVPVAVVW